VTSNVFVKVRIRNSRAAGREAWAGGGSGEDLRTIIAIAFAWGPAIDLAIEIVWTVRGTTHAAVRIGLALVAVVGRYAIARFAFRAATLSGTAVRLAVPTLGLGVALRLAWLWPILREASEAHRPGVVSNLVFPPAMVALYATLLPAWLPRSVGRASRDGDRSMAATDRGRSMAAVTLSVVLAQATLSGSFEFWDAAAWRLTFLGLNRTARFALGVLVPPFLLAGIAGFDRAAKGVRLTQLLFPFVYLGALPAILIFEAIASVAPLFKFADPILIAAARTPDGTQLVLTQTENDPYDVHLAIRRPGESWTRLPLVRNDPLWSGRLDVARQGTTATISAFDMVAATVDWQSGAVTHIAPMTWFKSVEWRPIRDPLCSERESWSQGCDIAAP
jgi:hypothetical protein